MVVGLVLVVIGESVVVTTLLVIKLFKLVNI